MNQSNCPGKPTLRKRSLRTLLLCAAIYLLACIGCASFQRRLIYFPPTFTAEMVDELAKSERLDRWSSPTGEPIGWKRLSLTQPAQGQVLIMHGNACCAFQCGHYAQVIQQAAAVDLFIVEYPGYADCAGKPSEVSLDQAAAKAFQLLTTNSPIYLLGESLGTGVAAYVAGLYPDKVAGIVLLAPYTRLADVAQAHMPIFPVRWLLSEHFPAEDYLTNYHGAVAVLIGGQDTVVPHKIGRRLYDGYSGKKRLWEFPQATHDTLMVQPRETWNEIFGFFQNETN